MRVACARVCVYVRARARVRTRVRAHVRARVRARVDKNYKVQIIRHVIYSVRIIFTMIYTLFTYDLVRWRQIFIYAT